MNLIDIIVGQIPRKLIKEELGTYTITFKEDDGKEQVSNVSGNSESDAKRRFLNSKEGRDIKVSSVISNTEDSLEELTSSDKRGLDEVDPEKLKNAASEYLNNGWDGAAMHIEDSGRWDEFYDYERTVYTLSSDREAKELYAYASEKLNQDEEITEENMTSNLDGGLGQPRTPNIFQRKSPTTSDKRKEYRNATSSTGYSVASKKRKNSIPMYEIQEAALNIIESEYAILEAKTNRKILSYIIDQYIHTKVSNLGPQSVSAIKKLEALQSKVDTGGQLSVDELHDIIHKMYPAVKHIVGNIADDIKQVENVNEASGTEPGQDNWVVYVMLHGGKKKKIADKKTKLAAVRIYNKLTSIGTEYEGIGMVHADVWEKEYARYSEGIVTEAKYSDYKTDETMSPKQKLNNTISEVNRKLYEIERDIRHASKFKSESGMEGDVFWSSTRSKIMKISERILRISNQLREFNK